MDQEQGRKLGSFLRTRREALDLTTRQLAAAVGVDKAQIIRLEQGTIASPKADMLARIAEILDVPTAEVYGLAGYTTPKDLPGFRPYMRAKYGELPDDAMAEMERIFTRLAHRHGVSGPLDGEDER